MSTPEPNHQLAKASGPLFDMPDQYHRLIGKLIYLTLRKLAYVVHALAQFTMPFESSAVSRVSWPRHFSLFKFPTYFDGLLRFKLGQLSYNTTSRD